jgi:hypothetical protein
VNTKINPPALVTAITEDSVETHSKVRFCVLWIYSFVIAIDIIPDSRQVLSSLFGIGRAFAQNLNSHSPRIKRKNCWIAVRCVSATLRTLRAESTKLQAALGCPCIRGTPVPVLDMYYGISYMICRLLNTILRAAFSAGSKFFCFCIPGCVRIRGTAAPYLGYVHCFHIDNFSDSRYIDSGYFFHVVASPSGSLLAAQQGYRTFLQHLLR